MSDDEWDLPSREEDPELHEQIDSIGENIIIPLLEAFTDLEEEDLVDDPEEGDSA